VAKFNINVIHLDDPKLREALSDESASAE